MKIFTDKVNLEEEMKKADAGDVDAMVTAAFTIVQMHPTEKDLTDRAIEYYKKAAELGNKAAMLDLGGIYMDGKFVERDVKTALEWYHRGWDPESDEACFCLGCISRYDYFPGGVEIKTRDLNRIKDALFYFHKGAELNDYNSIFELGELYLYGAGVEMDYNAAFAMYKKAFKLMDTDITNGRNARIFWRLGMCHGYGWGTPINEKEAVKYFEMAVDQWQYEKSLGSFDEQDLLNSAQHELDSLLLPMFHPELFKYPEKDFLQEDDRE